MHNLGVVLCTPINYTYVLGKIMINMSSVTYIFEIVSLLSLQF